MGDSSRSRLRERIKFIAAFLVIIGLLLFICWWGYREVFAPTTVARSLHEQYKLSTQIAKQRETYESEKSGDEARSAAVEDQVCHEFML